MNMLSRDSNSCFIPADNYGYHTIDNNYIIIIYTFRILPGNLNIKLTNNANNLLFNNSY